MGAATADDKPTRQDARWLDGLRDLARRRLAVAIGVPLLSGALLVGQVWLLAGGIADAVEGRAGLAELWPRLAGFAAILVVRIALGTAGEIAGASAAESIKLAVRQSLFTELLRRRLPVSLANGSSGALASTLIEQVESLDGYFSRYLPAMVQASILPFAFALLLLPVDWVAGLLFLVTAPLIPVFMALVGWGAEAASVRQAAAMQRLAGRFGDRLRGMVTLKLFGRASAETDAMVAASEELRRRTLGVLRIAFLSSAVLEFFAALGVAGVALYVGLSFLGLVHLRFSPLSFTSGLFLLLMAPEIYQPLRQLAANYHDRATARAAVAAMAATVGALPDPVGVKPEPAPVLAPLAVRPAVGLAVAGLTLRTPDGSRTILSHAGLTIPAGRQVALLGPSGSGKTTLLEAIARLRDFDGDIRLGGQPIEAIEDERLRRELGYLPQQSRLFHGTIADNMRLGLTEISPEMLRQAARLSRVADFADRLPLGLDTPLGEGGLGLSGGEAQRVALARLYLRNPSLILLDEPTAHLDRATEQAVLDGLLEFARGRTLLVSTHSEVLAGRLDGRYRLAGGQLQAIEAIPELEDVA